MFIFWFIKLGGTPLPWFEPNVQKEKENLEAKAYFWNKSLLVFAWIRCVWEIRFHIEWDCYCIYIFQRYHKFIDNL